MRLADSALIERRQAEATIKNAQMAAAQFDQDQEY
jgi:hypothetical protein